MELRAVVEAFDALAPLSLAADWDNVGLLVEGHRPLRKALLCIDLAPAVLAEALAAEIDLIVAYHPPIFRPLSRLTRKTAAERVIGDALRAGVSIYSPHTALDVVAGGMTDWLVACAGPVRGIEPIERVGDGADGLGRVATLVAPCSLQAAAQLIKTALGLQTVRVAGEGETLVTRVAACPGAGASVLRGARAVDLVLTGEMGHHDVLAWRAQGTAVVLTEHSNSERAFLPVWAEQLRRSLPGLTFAVSAVDADPLVVW